MQTFDTHVCIVSGEPLPNYLPAISKEIGRKKIVLLESPAMRGKADLLEAALKQKQRTVERCMIDDKSNLALFRQQIQTVLSQHPNAALNATGGLKTMSLVAHQVFSEAGRPVFYSERDNRIIWLNPIETPQQRLPGILDIDDYFTVFGQPLNKIQRAPLANDGGDAMLNTLQALPKASQGDHERMGERFESLVFRAATAALAALPAAGKQDVAWGVKTSGGTESNEFDVLITRNNILFMIECKNTRNTDDLANFIYKLENLRRNRGITARAALITTARVAADGGNAKRATDNRITLLDREDLPQLTEKLKLWLYAQG